MTTPNAVIVEACISTVWRRGSLVLKLILLVLCSLLLPCDWLIFYLKRFL